VRIGSLFSGIGGLELGLERAGVGETVWQVERDEFCQKVLAKHWPNAVRYEDVTEVDWSSVEPVEVLCGGFPCQDISFAGRGAGLEGGRSGLWWEYLRAIRSLRPRFVVVENVPALLHRGMGAVVGSLAACGYDAEWDCLPAASVGAPHRRDRLFILAYANGDGHGRVQPVSQRGRGGSAWSADDGENRAVGDPDRLVGAASSAREGQGRAMDGPRTVQRAQRSDGDAWRGWESEPDVGRVVDGVLTDLDLDRLRALGNAVVPQVAELVGRRVLELGAS